MIISGNRQREMPLQQDRERGQKLAYDEAVLLPNGEVLHLTKYPNFIYK